ncbi:hypothetical protein [uncultured Desulfobacter sp.]|uniref:hypothetical protein n=1 Tax=uncultured Desulfobacter sp. TaxID=240139 RepID=UPI002AA6CD38|nr:hypothetical protein [uncultured Desulfobacter sp.]
MRQFKFKPARVARSQSMFDTIEEPVTVEMAKNIRACMLLWLCSGFMIDVHLPILAAMVSAWSALLSSFEEVRQVLCDHGTILDVKVIRKLAYRYAERARVVQPMGLLPLNEEDNLQGRRVVISTDGGRTRLREKKRGPRTAKGRTRYHGAWREPKLLIIYVVDAHGKQEKSFAPFIDGCFNGPDGLFLLLKGYLKSLCIQKADKVLFIADGAHWIWNRVPGLIKALGLNPESVHELFDFYHAVEDCRITKKLVSQKT